VALARADTLLSHGRLNEAIARYRELLESEPDHFAAQNKLGFALMQIGQSQEAVATLERAVKLQPSNPEANNNLGLALMQVGRPTEAVASLRRAVELQPDYAEAHYNLAHGLITVGQPAEAVGEFRKALSVRPDWPAALGSLAWLQATQADPGVRNPEDAIRLASRAADLSGRNDVAVLDALAAAYAAAGRFDDATKTAEAAEALALSSAPALSAGIKDRLNLYREGHALMLSER
jgi:Flp pilus assembly protein TadD